MPAVDDAKDALGVTGSHLAGDERSTRVADEVGFLDLEMVEQRREVMKRWATFCYGERKDNNG